MENNNEYNFSIFKPITPYGKKNRNMVITMVIIWAVCVFGFQFLLRFTQKPVKEESFNVFITSVEALSANANDLDAKKQMASSLVLVNGKGCVKPADKEMFNNAISYLLIDIGDNTNDSLVRLHISAIVTLKEELAKSTDEKFAGKKSELDEHVNALSSLCCTVFGFDPNDIKAKIVPFYIVEPDMSVPFDSKTKELKKAMNFYTTHLQSGLTDTIFLGFPFHYFFTAVFLLILFVVLCLIYCIQTEKLQKRFKTVE